MNILVLGIMLIAFGVAVSGSAFAADINNINRAAAMEKQRNINKANLSKKRHFDRKPKATNSLKLDALPQSPRRGAYRASSSHEHSFLAKARATRNPFQ